MKYVKTLASALTIAVSCLISACDNSPEISANLPAPSAIPKIPDFKSFTDTQEKKQAFFNHFYILVERANLEVLTTRQELQALQNKELQAEDIAKITELCQTYRAPCSDEPQSSIQQLLSRIDLVPPSLALAQAANESAWGTSRFALQANNYFGQWCFTKGCGLVPKSRSAGLSHEVRKFDSAMAAVRGYVFNINSSSAYQELRDYRRQSNDVVPNSLKLVKGLSKYSERGQDYIEEISHMIRFNRLTGFDQKFARLLTPSQ
jgi:Bax protein